MIDNPIHTISIAVVDLIGLCHASSHVTVLKWQMLAPSLRILRFICAQLIEKKNSCHRSSVKQAHILRVHTKNRLTSK